MGQLDEIMGNDISLPSWDSDYPIPNIFNARRHTTGLDKPIFVVGVPRSGTTLFGACLGGHEHLASSEESLFLLDMWRIATDLHSGNNPRNWAPLAPYINSSGLLDTIGDFSDKIFNSLITAQGKVRYVDHTPWYIACLPMIRALYPECIVIHMIRDGRQVVRSLQDSYSRGFQWAGKTIQDSSKLWVNLLNQGIHQAKENKNSRYLEVRYENLCSNPIKTIQAVSSFCGISWDKNMLKALATPHANPSRSNVPLAQISVEESVLIKPREELKSWPSEWDESDKKIFLDVAGSTMKRLKYL